MSSSSERFVDGLAPLGSVTVAPVVPSDQVGDVSALPTPELRTGVWTRHGDANLLGDPVAESLLGEVATAARAAAEAQGYAVGWAQGRREAEAEARRVAEEVAGRHAEAEARREAEHAEAMVALARAADEVHGRLGGMCARVEERATDLAWALVEELVGREVSVATSADVVRRVLRLLPPGIVATVRMHPDIAAGAAAVELEELGLKVVADATLARADALVAYDGTVIDLRVDSALERVREALA
jgi:flagellar assembly protein FliH